MVTRGCNAFGELDNTHYAKPLPWIGLYVAVASLLCTAAMALDALFGICRRRLLWLPPRLFSLNSATLTLLSVATKFPVDLNTSMPGRADQLTKLSGTALICTAMANFMPSMGAMDDSAIVSNVAALAIFVVTVVVDVCIQMGTGAIYAFLPEHVTVLAIMLALLVLSISSALAVASTKRLLRYECSHKGLTAAAPSRFPQLEWVTTRVKMHWLMNDTACAEYMSGRSATCTASGALCLVGASVFTHALFRAHSSHMQFCQGTSDYQSSTTLVLIFQAGGVLIGAFAPVYRLCYDGCLRSLEGRRSSCARAFLVDAYWVHMLKEWKDGEGSPDWCYSIWSRSTGLLLVKHPVLAALILLQSGVVWASQFVRLIAAFIVRLSLDLCYISRLVLRKAGSHEEEEMANENQRGLEAYVLPPRWNLDRIMKQEATNMAELMDWRGGYRSKALVQLIDVPSGAISRRPAEEGALDSAGKAPKPHPPSRLVPKEPPHCWALQVVSLAAIAVALPSIDAHHVNSLLRGVSEGLIFVKLVETNLDEVGGGSAKMRGAADIVWLGVDLYRRWFDWDLHSLVLGEDGNRRKVVEAMMQIAQREVTEFVQKLPFESGVNRRDPLAWPERVLAANCMYRTCATILQVQDYDAGRYGNDAYLLAWLWSAISEMLGACLTNLPRAICLECFSSRDKAVEKGIQHAARLVREAGPILQVLEQRPLSAEEGRRILEHPITTEQAEAIQKRLEDRRRTSAEGRYL